MSTAMQGRARLLEQADLLGPSRREWTLGELLSILARRNEIVVGCVAAMCFLASVYCVFATRRYEATGQIEVQKDSRGTLGLDRSLTDSGSTGDVDALDTSMSIETDAQILRSSTLALMVIHDLKLETTEEYFPPLRQSIRIPQWVFFWRTPLEPLSIPLSRAPNRRYVALKIFASHLKVTPMTGTRLIDVNYSSPDPRLASEVVNHLIEALEEYTFESRFQATAQASSWLGGQLAGLKKQTEDLQQRANQLEQGTGIYGDDASHNLVLTRLDGLNGALAAAETNRILKQAVYEVAMSGDPELISGLAGNGTTGTSQAMTNSLALLQTLRGQEAQVQAEIDEDSARYGSAYPKIAELHAELDGIEKSIQQEIGRIGDRARTDYEIAQRAEDAARASFEKQKDVANSTNDRTVAYELAKQEADASRNLYQGLLGKLKEAGVLEGLHSTNLAVVNAGMVPPTNRPNSPNMPLCFAAAMAGGLFLGCAGALIREAMDESVRSVDELERMLGVPLAGVVPEFGTARRFRWGWAKDTKPALGAANAVRLKRSFALPLRGADSQAVLISSAVPGDGKSGVAVSVAASLARSGATVLLVDADLLCPSLHRVFGVEKAQGLAETLSESRPAETHEWPKIPGLSLMWAGNAEASAKGDAADLLASPRMDALMNEWREKYDFVVLDSAPVLPVPDAASLARFCDRTLLVVRYGSTTMQAARRSYQMISRHLPERAALEVVMNGVPQNSPDYFSYYGYKRSPYGQKARTNA